MEELHHLAAYYFGIIFPDGSDAYSKYAENRNRLWICHQVNYLDFDMDYPGQELLY